MPEFTSQSQAPQALPDPWERAGPIPLDGVLERNRFNPLLVVFIALIVGLSGYMILGNVATIVLLVLQGVSLEAMLRDMMGVMEDQPAVLLSGNAVGLLLGMGLVALLLARLHSSRLWAFLRLRKPDATALALGLVGLLALIPVVQWTGSVNEQVPLPEWLRALEDVQMELLEKVLQGDVGVLISLVMVAITPALCEEVFFRGYLQRHLERGLGVGWGLVATGVVFGLFHLRLTQLLPLSILGVYLAYLAWRTGSLWVPVAVHFANNAIAVATAEFVKNQPDLDITDVEQLAVPWYIVFVSLVVFCSIVYVLQGWTRQRLTGQVASSFDTQIT